MSKKYSIKFGSDLIGTTEFESADAPMGVVIGRIEFHEIESGYDFVISKAGLDGVIINENEPEDCYVHASFENLSITSKSGTEIVGLGVCISGFESEGYEIEVLGIPYPFYEEEFPHHRKAYDNQFK